MSKPKIEWYKVGEGSNYKIHIECNSEAVDSITDMLDSLESAIKCAYMFGAEDGERHD